MNRIVLMHPLPEAGRVEILQIDEVPELSLDIFYKALSMGGEPDVDVIQIHPELTELLPGCTAYVDEEGMLRDDPSHVAWECRGVTIYGPVLIVGDCDDEGADTTCPHTAEEIRQILKGGS